MTKSRETDSFIIETTEKSQKPRRCRYFLPIVAVISVISNLVILSVFLSTLMRPSHLKGHVEDGEKTALCFDCSYLGPDVNTEDILYTVNRTTNLTLCCVQDDAIRRKALQFLQAGGKHTEEKETSTRIVADFFSNLRQDKIGAHLFMDTQALNGGQLSWVDNNNGESTSEVQYQANVLRISTPGKYLVYSHVAFHQRLPNTMGGDTFVHRLTRFNPRQPNLGRITLLFSKLSYPQFSGSKSSFLSGVLALRSGDELGITVSDTDNLMTEQTSGYFGVIKLS